MGKLPGKTDYSGRRRTATRESGFKSHPNSTGGEFKQETVTTYDLKKDEKLVVTFNFPATADNRLVGFGAYFRCKGDVAVWLDNPNTSKSTLDIYAHPNWSKAGSLWVDASKHKPARLVFEAKGTAIVDVYDAKAGVVWHEFYDGARQALMKNIHEFAPEANFYEKAVDATVTGGSRRSNTTAGILLKTCNRCARYLPINTENERSTLSFSNHCIARAPCKHATFGRLRGENDEELQLHYGFQLECRICKKFAVNAALNPQRTTAQMKEDGQRRRHFELLISELYQMSPQLAYRHKTGKELSEEVWKRFGRQCFNCAEKLASSSDMHLDHTRPLALLWQLDETATALCPECNNKKRDRSPSEFYSVEKLAELARITGLTLDEISAPHPNHEVIEALDRKIDWLMDVFLMRPDLQKVRDGKVTAELVCKALDKVVERSGKPRKVSYTSEYHRRRRKT